MKTTLNIIGCVLIVLITCRVACAGEIYSFRFTSVYTLLPGVSNHAETNITQPTTLTEDIKPVAASSVTDIRKSPASQLVIYVLLTVLVLCIIILFIGIIELISGRRKPTPLNSRLMKDLILSIVISLPFYVGIYLFPLSLKYPSGTTLPDYAADDISFMIKWMIALITLGVLLYHFFRIFQKRSQVKQSIPFVITLSLLTGIANTSFIFLVANSIHFKFHILYLIYYFFLAMMVFVLSKKIAETKLIKLMLTIIYQYRLKLVDKILFSSYRDFEKIDRGRIMEILSGDTKRIGRAASMMVAFLTFFVSAVCAFAYLATISLVATGLTLLVTVILASLYIIVSSKAQHYFEKARDSENTFMSFVNGMINGFKELTINPLKKQQYKAEFIKTCDEYRSAQSIANVKFIDVTIFGNVLIMSLIGSLVVGLPVLMPDISPAGLVAYIMVILYIIGPVNAIVQMIPGIIEIKVSWRRIQKFLNELKSPEQNASIISVPGKRIHQFEVKDISFGYNDNGEDNFSVGPVNFKLESGQILFIVGGNGSGKTTLGKLLTGLYRSDRGSVKINGKEVSGSNLGNHFSTVFSDFYLFKKVYGFDKKVDENAVNILKTLQLTQKVKIGNNEYSTIELSNGQRKRLALLQCFLEDKPVYLFDEWAADQDPVFRKYFYHELLPSMKDKGKIIIAITHDEHYFNTADIILKLDMGNQEFLKQPEKLIFN